MIQSSRLLLAPWPHKRERQDKAEVMVGRITVTKDGQLVGDKRVVHYDETGSFRGCHIQAPVFFINLPRLASRAGFFHSQS